MDGLSTKANARVLVIGASGGVGHLAVQIAKRGLGAALVVGVCSSRNEDFVRACGADAVVAYDRTPIETIAREHPEWKGTFDLIFDTVGIDTAWTILAPQLLSATGRFVAAAIPQLAGRPIRRRRRPVRRPCDRRALHAAPARRTLQFHLRNSRRRLQRCELCRAGAMDRRGQGDAHDRRDLFTRPARRRPSRERDRPDGREDCGGDGVRACVVGP